MKGLPVLLVVILAACGGSSQTKKPDGKASDAKGKAEEANLLVNKDRDQLLFDLDKHTDDWWSARQKSRPTAYSGLERLLRRLVEDNLEAVLEILKDEKNPRGRAIVSKALAFTPNPKAIAALCELLTSDDPELVLHALMGLARQARPTHPIDKIAVHLDSFDSRIQGNAALAVYRAVREGAPLKGPARERTLTRLSVLLLDDQHPMVRGNAAAALGAIGDPRSETELLNLLNDDDGYVRLRAIMALSHVGTDRSLDPLLDVLGAPEPNIRTMAARSLWIITRRLKMKIDGSVLGDDAKAWREAIEQRRAGG